MVCVSELQKVQMFGLILCKVTFCGTENYRFVVVCDSTTYTVCTTLSVQYDE